MRKFGLLFTLLGLLCLAAPAQSATVGSGPPLLETEIVDGPEEGSLVEGDSATFSFAATLAGAPLPGAEFSCALDGDPAIPCDSPFVAEELEDGNHTFLVAAEDPTTTIADPTAAARSFVSAADSTCDDEGEGDEEGDDEGSEEEESDEGEACEAEGSSGRLPPRECLLRSARAALVAGPEKLRLSLRYTTFAAADAQIAYRLSGGKGSLQVVDRRRHLARRGVLKLVEKLDKSEAARARASRRAVVEIEMAGTPGNCRRYGVRRLAQHRAAHNRLAWLQAGSIFGPGS